MDKFPIEISHVVHKLNNLNMVICNYVALLIIKLNKNRVEDKDISEILERINDSCQEVFETSKKLLMVYIFYVICLTAPWV